MPGIHERTGQVCVGGSDSANAAAKANSAGRNARIARPLQ